MIDLAHASIATHSSEQVGVASNCLLENEPALFFSLPMWKVIVPILLLCVLSWTMVLSPVSVKADSDSDDFQEMEPEDRYSSGGIFDRLSNQLRDSDFGPGDTEDGGDFGNVDFSGDEVEPADLDREGDFGDTYFPPKKTDKTIQ